MKLEIIPPGALSWAPTRYRPVVPPTEEYGRRACEAGGGVWRRYLDYLAERGMPAAPVLEIAFLETVGDERDGRVVGKAGFCGHATPYRIYIVTDKAPLDEVAWWVRHEVAHTILYLLFGAASDGPRGEALADEIAGPDVPAGHAEWLALTADRLVMYPPSWLVAEILPAIEAGDETLALPDLAPGITVTHGKITVNSGAPGAGTVIIDGTSDMLKIATKGSLGPIAGPNAGSVTIVGDYPNGLTSPPAHQGFANDYWYGQLPHINVGGAGDVLDAIQLDAWIVSGNQTEVTARYTSKVNRSGDAWSVSFFIFKEARI